MKPTQEQVIAWAREAGIDVDTWMGVSKSALTEFFTLAYEAGRKDENEACVEVARNFFTAARIDYRHIDLGDIRLTIGDQEDLEAAILVRKEQ